MERLADPEAGPANPTATLAAQAAAEPEREPLRRRTGDTAEIWRLAWPVMLSHALVTASGLVDIGMVGRLSAEAQAAVGYATQFFFFAQAALFAMSFACVALMARAIGAGDLPRARETMAGSLLLSFGVSIVFATAILVAPETLLGWLSATPEVSALCVPYLRLVMAASVVLSFSIVLESGMRANRDTRTPMQIAIVVTAVKIGLNAVLIFGGLGFPRLELAGAGLATLISQIVGLGVLAVVVARTARDSPVAARLGDLRRAGPLMGSLIRIALPGVAERVVMNLAMLSYFAVLGSRGTVAVAAYTIGVRVLSFSWIPGIGYSQAVGTLVGQSLGAGEPARARGLGVRAAGLALGTAGVLGIVGGLAREPLARIFTADEATVATLLPFMASLALVQPILQLHFTLGGVHRGAGDTLTPLISALVGNWLIRVPLAVLAVRVFDADLVWVWLALILDHVARAAVLVWSFRRGRWQQLEPG